ncbi:ribonuclease domain-containing protein [Streptomyces sp. NPDC021096]|uniref:ribonuclease domain-containing protein n=1 Tax=Streptomyces sp. NPDC021096 TaxID=3154792 RepID=UPI00340CDCAF
MTTFRSARHVTAAALLLSAVALSPAPGAPTATAAVRPADVIDPPLPVERFPAQVKNACGIWKGLNWPASDRAHDYPVARSALVIRGGNIHRNLSGHLPATGHYREYDVTPRPPGRRRDAERLVRDPGTRTVWYTADHYRNFRKITSGCP